MKQYVDQFINDALKAGMPREKIASLLSKADEISTRGNKLQPKLAESYLDNTINQLLTSTGFDKTASSVAYTHGLLKSAIDAGASPAEAMQITKAALAQTYSNLTHMQKVSAVQNDPNLYNYALGFVKSAVAKGYNEQEAWNYVVNLIDQEKQAAHGGNQMFKQDVSQGGPGGAPGGPGGDPTGGMGGGPGGAGGGQPSEDDVMALLQSLPPEEQQQVLQQFLAMISGGQGGPGGAGAGSPAMPPQGGGAPGGLPPTGPGGQ